MYSDKIYSNYVTSHIKNIYKDVDQYATIKPYLEAYFKRFIPQDLNAKILDIGCGSGEFLMFLKSLGYTNIFGIDLSKEQIQLAINRGLKNLEMIDAIEYLLHSKESFTLITAHDVIEHLPKEKIFKFLNAVSNSLAKNGTIIFSTVNAESPFGARHRYYDFTHEVSFTPTSISQVLRVAGFDVIGVFPKEPVVHGIKSLIRWALWKVIKQFVKLYLLVETGSVGYGVYTQVMFVVGRKK